MTTSNNDQAQWADAALPPLKRAELLLNAMNFDDKVNLVMGNTNALTHLHIPSLERVDASAGLRGDTGVTALPSPTALSATFDQNLAYAYGAAIGTESREHGWAVILGPTVDVERRGMSGRLPEGFGEDPLLNSIIGERVSRGMQDQHLITCLKHYTAYNQERGRNFLNITVSQRALHELYDVPFVYAIEQGSALSLMGSYPKINGTYACENGPLLDQLRAETGWQGFMMSDFLAGEDSVAGFNAGMDSTTLYPRFPREAFSDGRITAARLDEAVRRTLYAIFASGLYEHPVGPLNQAKPVSTPEHKALAQQVAEQGIVLLKNHNAILPLERKGLRSLAVIGCAGRDCMTGPEGSSYVVPGDYVTPLAAITAAAGNDLQVRVAQGTRGDHPLPIVPSAALTTPDGTSAGLLGTFYANPNFSGDAVATQIAPTLDFSKTPIDGLPGGWSARWTGKITSPVTSRINFSVLCSGEAKLYIDGHLVLNGQRDTTMFVIGAYYYPLRGFIEMTANKPVEIVIEFSSPFHPIHMFMGKHMHLGWQTEPLFDEAVAAAKQSDAAIVFVNHASGEGMDRGFDLPGDQNDLIAAVCAANPNTIVVLNTPGAVIMPWLNQAKAVLQAWFLGEAIGSAIANVLFGAADPGGRLPITLPANEAQTLPAYDGSGQVTFAEDVFTGYRHFMRHGHAPTFAFGHGLSYTQFEYTAATVASAQEAKHAATVELTVRNIGQRTGHEVVQVYVGLPADASAPVPLPAKQLAGFAKVTLKPSESVTAQIAIPWRVLSYWDEGTRAWVKLKGRINVYIGRSLIDDQIVKTIDL